MPGDLQQLRQGRGKVVVIKALKAFALEKFPTDCALRDVLLAERDKLDVNEFLAKMDIWMKLLRRARP